jgi:hypothetical protein
MSSKFIFAKVEKILRLLNYIFLEVSLPRVRKQGFWGDDIAEKLIFRSKRQIFCTSNKQRTHRSPVYAEHIRISMYLDRGRIAR